MDKIKDLLTKNGLSAEAASRVCESLQKYTAQAKQRLDEEFKSRLAKAKQVCLEETEAHKAELARRVQVFLETKGPAIEESIARQAAERETESASKLEQIAAVVEGIQLNGQSNSALTAELAKLKKVAGRILEERDHALKKANNLRNISERLVTKNRDMQKALVEATGNGAVKTAPERIDESRKGGTSKTTRRTLKENVDKTPPPPAAGPETGSNLVPKSPEEIAGVMEDVV